MGVLGRNPHVRTAFILPATIREVSRDITGAEIRHAYGIFDTIIRGYDYDLRQYVTTFLRYWPHLFCYWALPH